MTSSVAAPSPATRIDLIAANLPVAVLLLLCAAIALLGSSVALPANTIKTDARIIDVFVIHFMRSSLLFPGKGDSDIFFAHPTAVISKLFNHIYTRGTDCRHPAIIFTYCHANFQNIPFAIRINNHSLVLFGSSHN